MSETEIYAQDLDSSNWDDLLYERYATGLFGIVDEAEGGIIAYAIGQENALRIVRALSGVAAFISEINPEPLALDPEPFVVVSNESLRMSVEHARWTSLITAFDPRPDYSQNLEDYQ